MSCLLSQLALFPLDRLSFDEHLGQLLVEVLRIGLVLPMPPLDLVNFELGIVNDAVHSRVIVLLRV